MVVSMIISYFLRSAWKIIVHVFKLSIEAMKTKKLKSVEISLVHYTWHDTQKNFRESPIVPENHIETKLQNLFKTFIFTIMNLKTVDSVSYCKNAPLLKLF